MQIRNPDLVAGVFRTTEGPSKVEVGGALLLSRFCFQSDEQRDLNHFLAPHDSRLFAADHPSNLPVELMRAW
jgi:hypothetical protein